MTDNLKRSVGFPLGGGVRTKARPIATLIIIALNIIVYAITSYANAFLEISDYWVSAGGFVPSLIANPLQWYRIFSSMFLHADFFHILFNMYFLYIFGRAVENALGGLRFLALYVISGLVASIFHTAFSFLGGFTAYVVPAIGASGAISGVLGAYLILFPGTSLVMGWGFLFFPFFFRMKAAYYLIFWFATQLIYGYARMAGSTAVFAHAGGFIAGIALLSLVASKDRLIQFRLARQQALFQAYVIFSPAPTKSAGLGKITKTIIAVLLASLLFGAAYASSGLSIKGYVKSATIQYTYEGTPYMDYVGLQLPDVADQLASITLDPTRILANRLYAAGLLYDNSKRDYEGSFNWQGELRVAVDLGAFTRIIDVPTAINLNGKFDADGFLNYGEGNLTTYVIEIIPPYPPRYQYELRLSQSPVSYTFEFTSQTVNLTYITQCTGMVSLVATAFALIVTLKKDRDLTLISEEPERLMRPYTPYYV
ncbi:MAG: rhomboid family intramembrane serine protease [Candidatus Bathyarchaeia archaeon]